MTMSGVVTYVGRSSMEVEVTLSQNSVPALIASFTLVARDDTTGKSASINTLHLSTPEEHARFALGKERKLRKKEASATCLSKVAPTADEYQLLHTSFLHPPGTDCVSPTDTQLQSVILCHPQHKNMKKSIFGGYLMQESFALAWATAHVFAGQRPVFRAVDEISFLRPVSIGDIIELTSAVVYSHTQPVPSLQIRVETKILDISQTGVHKTCNVAHYTFDVPEDATLRTIHPHTYSEAMDMLDGRRRHARAFEVGAE
mmetsp:Transcript_54065/g.117652  ORF Transcript_54065/g.117652 Transcript_54065/m.117652 type:complete len:258 (-) Transcript_54065:104-877(-)